MRFTLNRARALLFPPLQNEVELNYGILTIVCGLLLSSWAHGTSLSADERAKFKLHLSLIKDLPDLLNDEQLDLLAEVQGHTDLDKDLMAFLSLYEGKSADITTYIRKLSAWQKQIGGGHSQKVIDEWLRYPGMEEIAQMYRDLLARGWAITLTNEPIIVNGINVAGAMSASKTVRVRVQLGDEAPALVLAEEILHASDWEMYEEHKSAIDKWLSYVIAENNTPGIDKVNQAERYNWQTQFGLSQMAVNAVTRGEVAGALEFLLEQSAYFQKIEIYKALVRGGQQFKSFEWEKIIATSDPREAINLVLSEIRFPNLPPGLSSRIGPIRISQILAQSDYASGNSILVGLHKSPTAKPKLPWKTVNEFLAIVPASLKNIDFYMVNAFSDSQMDRHAAKYSTKDIEALGAYMLNPHLVDKPYQAERELGNGVRLYAQFEYLSAVMVQFDIQHGTQYAIKYGFKMLSQLHRDAATRDHESLFTILARRLKASDATPAMAKDFFDSLLQSRSAGGFINELNGLDRLEEALRLAVGAVPPLTMDAILMSRFDFMQARSLSNREGSAYLDLFMAQQTLTTGLKIMRQAGDKELVREYETRLAAIESALKRLQSQSHEQYRMRDRTPKDYDDARMPRVAARLIITADAVRKAKLKNQSEASQQGMRDRLVKLWKSCEPWLRGK